MTSYLLYTLAQLGFKVDILKYGINVIMDVVNLSVELHDSQTGQAPTNVIDLSEPTSMEG